MLNFTKILAILAWGVLDSGSAPPPTPTHCTTQFCIELMPALSVNRSGFVKASKKIIDLGNQSRLIAEFEGLGSIEVVGPYFAEDKQGSLTYDSSNRILSIVSCDEKRELKLCWRYVAIVDDRNLSRKPLVCNILSFWPATQDEGSTQFSLGERISLDRELVPECS